jgi:hypothetical protein
MQAKHSIRNAPMIGYESERYYFAQNSLHPVLPDRMILIYPAGQEKKRCFNGSGDRSNRWIYGNFLIEPVSISDTGKEPACEAKCRIVTR